MNGKKRKLLYKMRWFADIANSKTIRDETRCTPHYMVEEYPVLIANRAKQKEPLALRNRRPENPHEVLVTTLSKLE